MTNDQVHEPYQAREQRPSDDLVFHYTVGHFGVYLEPSEWWGVMHLRSRRTAGFFPTGVNALKYATALDKLPINWDVSSPDCSTFRSETDKLAKRFKNTPIHTSRRTRCLFCGNWWW